MLAWNELLTDLAWHEILHRHFRPLQNRKWITAKWLTHGKQLQEVAVWGTLKKKKPSSRPILIYFEFRSKPSLITVICMNPHLPNKFKSVATKYCFLILRADTCFFFLIISLFFIVFFFKFYVIINFYKKYFIIIILLHFFFMKIILFFHVPECSAFRVYRRPSWSAFPWKYDPRQVITEDVSSRLLLFSFRL